MKTKHHSILSTPVTQSGDHVRNNSIRRKWSALALGGFLFTSIFALSAPSVEAQCQQWNVGHKWAFKQGPTKMSLDLQQNGTVITGSAIYTVPGDSGGLLTMGKIPQDVTGSVDGTVKGDSFAVKIYWDNNTIGVYNGTIRPSGKIEGTGYEQRSSSTKVNWYSATVMKCADAKVGAGAPDWMKAAPKSSKPINTATDEWIEQKKREGKNKTYDANDPNRPRGFINGLQLGTPTPSAEADESSSTDTEDQHKKKKNKNKNKKKKKHHHHDDDENQGND